MRKPELALVEECTYCFRTTKSSVFLSAVQDVTFTKAFELQLDSDELTGCVKNPRYDDGTTSSHLAMSMLLSLQYVVSSMICMI